MITKLKEQAVGIAGEKVQELVALIPALRKEIIWDKSEDKWGYGWTKIQKDYVEVIFKNGSRFDVVAAKESSRGGRRHSGLIDEVSEIACKPLFCLSAGLI